MGRRIQFRAPDGSIRSVKARKPYTHAVMMPVQDGWWLRECYTSESWAKAFRDLWGGEHIIVAAVHNPSTES